MADPIEQVRTPEIFNKVLPLCGVDAVMVPLRVAPEDLVETVRVLFRSPTTAGMVLSIPHKTCAAGLVDKRSKIASSANAVNAIRRNADGSLEGELFDGIGFVKSLERYHMPYAGKRVLLVGAGGAGSAIATALAASEVAHISIYDPDTAKASQLAAALTQQLHSSASAAGSNDPAGFDLVINASPLGLRKEDPLPLPVERLSPHAQVCDILMKNQPTPLLRAAMAEGHAVQPGFDMLILQTPLFLDFFGLSEAAATVRADDSAVREMLYPSELTGLFDRL
ncbi:shikimate dehydrogenase family protein [Pseudomonas putida]|uniref:shikimate dehydrogenase family protein n=1 Tax=Pseudomonas putida TaxID=303 RepID=UPI0039063222